MESALAFNFLSVVFQKLPFELNKISEAESSCSNNGLRASYSSAIFLSERSNSVGILRLAAPLPNNVDPAGAGCNAAAGIGFEASAESDSAAVDSADESFQWMKLNHLRFEVDAENSG